MDKITANAETLMRQASMTADEYLRDAIENIDARLGGGFAGNGVIAGTGTGNAGNGVTI